MANVATRALRVTAGCATEGFGALFDTFGVHTVLIGIRSMVLVFGVIPAVVGRRVSDPE